MSSAVPVETVRDTVSKPYTTPGVMEGGGGMGQNNEDATAVDAVEGLGPRVMLKIDATVTGWILPELSKVNMPR